MNRRLAIGLLLILFGSLFLLRNLNFIPEIPSYIFSWPLILIAIGLFNFLNGNVRSALVLMIIGGFFFLDRFVDLNLRQYWPILLILVGVILVLFSNKKMHRGGSDHFFDDLNVFSGSNKKFVSDPLEGGRITNIFGGSDVDLRESKPKDGARIDVITLFGGCDLIVPTDWNVKVETISIFGGFSDKRPPHGGTPKANILVKGVTIFGGGEIKSTKI